MSEELIVVRQLPVIEERLKNIRDEIKARAKEALALVCTEETVKEIKKVRTDLSKSFKELETQRKEVKARVLAPYEQFEAVYKECVTDIFAPVDKELKIRIDEVENALKEEKRSAVREYFAEYATSKGIDFADFECASISVGLSSSIKSLKAEAAAYIDRISDDLALIETQEHKAEILVEYKTSLNVSRAVTTVKNRHAAIEAENKRREAMLAAQPPAELEPPQAASAPIPTPAPQTAPDPEPPVAAQDTAPEAPATKTFSVSFTVCCTIEQLRALKQFLTDGQYNYTENR